MAGDYLTKTDKEARRQLALDYTYGFDFRSKADEQYIRHAIIHGHVPKNDLKYFTHFSLTRRAEEWHQLLACANSLREKITFDDPLEGQDLLTFVTKVLSSNSKSRKDVTAGQTSSLGLEHEHKDAARGPQSNTTPRQAMKRKRAISTEQTDLDQPAKKHRMNKKSPFWSTSEPNPPHGQANQLVGDTKALNGKKSKSKKKTKKRMRERKARESLHEATTTSSPLVGGVVLPKNSKVCRGLNNISASSKFHNRECMSGHDGVLHKIIPLRISHRNTEAKESFASQQTPSDTPGNVKGAPRTAMMSLGKSDDTGEASERGDNDTYPLPLAKCLTANRKTKSPFFDVSTPSGSLKTKGTRAPRGIVPCIPFPRLDAPNFGLIQESLATDPFLLLVAVTFLIRVKGKQSIPVFHELVGKYPTPRHLAEADKNDIIATIRHLGLSTVRATAIQKYARIWIENPPRADIRYGVKNYPQLGDGADVRAAEELSTDDPRSSAWEIGHMTQGRYAIDSWRIFCRDVLLNRAEDWRGKGREGKFQPEWMRVLPEDKELRACLRWLWMQDGYAWDPKTGEKDILSEDLRRAVNEGRVAYDEAGELKILD
ncbi:DNA glycosylase [Daldinia caldariorum]|uniref:DNA glycosylase n=1 Tax=Daldinia caldariorum TaxID=326644 RepID=UPI002008A8AB|nr:DNA glycosylase [Daldinia caldariorum]KAI1467409.1 DNA glycosylase [Daldinia caldariorum]